MTRSLVSPADLASRLDGPTAPVLLDVRWRLGGPHGRPDYLAGHLPAAAFVDLDADLAAPPGDGGRHPLPDPADLQAALRAAGVREDRPVVVYDADNAMAAARAWWLLRWAGHDQVAVLDGGYAAWTAAGLPVATGEETPAPGDITVRPGAMPVLTAEDAAALPANGTLLDARAPERYRGEVEPMDPRAGHIPGALNAPFAGNTTAEGRWHSPTELAQRFTALGVSGGEIGAYCGSGITAASLVLALEVAGVTAPNAPAALYAGSWSHWCADAGRPVATGPNP
ncbi:sulfurtransferase [Actinokineospora guangxiensis]|uniref:Sulfurtransferase n=1 Tax=Actinokineospora guangxiensis TaxID=1490288 RepID=A0ABW0EJY7_9PSEU